MKASGTMKTPDDVARHLTAAFQRGEIDIQDLRHLLEAASNLRERVTTEETNPADLGYA
jgi:hypothetical protein